MGLPKHIVAPLYHHTMIHCPTLLFYITLEFSPHLKIILILMVIPFNLPLILKTVLYHYFKFVKIGKSLNWFFFSYISNWTLKILVNEGISLKVFMDVIV